MIAIVPTHHSRPIARIGDALARYAPNGMKIHRIGPMRNDSRRNHRIPGEEDGDVVVFFANGLRDHYLALADRCIARGQKFAVIQIVLRTSRHPSTEQWRSLWSRAAVVWSYYPLPLWIREDGGSPVDFLFYEAPLGVDGTIFYDRQQPRTYTVCTSGRRRNQEGVGECDDAAFELGGSIFQLGPTFPMHCPTTYLTDLTDDTLAIMYSRCDFVSGLRRHEGFELPGAEGLLCGARPIFFDRPHYRRWFDPWGEFIPEGSPREVTLHLIDLFRAGARPVTEAERQMASAVFDWQRIVSGFWAAVLHPRN